MAEPRTQITYRDYLIWTASNTVAALSERIRMAIDMRDEVEAIKVLEHALDITPALASYSGPNPETVGPRPLGDEIVPESRGHGTPS